MPIQGTQVQSLVREISSHMPRCSEACVPQWWSLNPRARAPLQEKPGQWEAHTQLERGPRSPAARDSPYTATKTQRSQNFLKMNFKKHWHKFVDSSPLIFLICATPVAHPPLHFSYVLFMLSLLYSWLTRVVLPFSLGFFQRTVSWFCWSHIIFVLYFSDCCFSLSFYFLWVYWILFLTT